MTLKDLLIQELDNVSEPLIVEVLDFLRFLKTKQPQDSPNNIATRSTFGKVSQPELYQFSVKQHII
jgi:hypothetical protein